MWPQDVIVSCVAEKIVYAMPSVCSHMIGCLKVLALSRLIWIGGIAYKVRWRVFPTGPLRFICFSILKQWTLFEVAPAYWNSILILITSKPSTTSILTDEFPCGVRINPSNHFMMNFTSMKLLEYFKLREKLYFSSHTWFPHKHAYITKS